jgi:hypothetical protein
MTVSGATASVPDTAPAEAGRDSMRLLERALAAALVICAILLGFLR